MKKNIVVFGFIFFLTFNSAQAMFSLPSSRSVQWQGNVGVLNDIPIRTSICSTLSPSGGDDTVTIQNAINSCPSGQVVKLNAGTFNIHSMISLKSNVTLRGSGMGISTIRGISGASGYYLVEIAGGYKNGTVNVASGSTKGSLTVTTQTNHNLSVGDIVLIDQVNTGTNGDPVIINVGNNGTCTWCGRRDSNGNIRSSGEIAKVAAVINATTVQLEIPIYWNYSNLPQLTKMSGTIINAGIEDLTIDNGLSGSSGQAATFNFSGSANCWLNKVELIGAYSFMLNLDSNYRATIRSCKFHEGVPATPYSGDAYDGTKSRANGLVFETANSANLIENNTFYNLSQPLFLKGAASGNVIAYNYIPKLYRTDNMLWNVDPINFHGAHPMMNLIEGNIAQGRFVSDNVWGSTSHNTFFRNKNFTGSNITGGFWNYELAKYVQYENIIGNVIGNSSFETVYELNNVVLNGQPANFRFGYESDGDGSPMGNDPQVYNTTLRHGNWTSVPNSGNNVNWDPNYADHILPNSMYLASKPSWWGTMPWPAIGSDLNPMSSEIPAMQLYDGAILPPDNTCTSLKFISGIASPNVVTPNNSYSITCDYGSIKDAVYASNDLGQCTWLKWSGTIAYFACNSGDVGIRQNRCWLSASSGENICSQTNNINDVKVGSYYSSLDFTNMLAYWHQKNSIYDFDGNLKTNSRDLGIMMTEWK